MKTRITYAPTTYGKTHVFLDGRRVGDIHYDFVDQSYQYFPKGKTVGGDLFISLAEVKSSLEAGHAVSTL